MKTLLALAVIATASLTTTAFANDVSSFDFSSQAAMLDEGAIIDLDAHGMVDNKPKPLPITRSINFAVAASAHKPEEAFSKVTEAAAKICREHKGSIRNLNYFAFGKLRPRNDGMDMSVDANRPANSVGVRVSCALGK